MLPLCARRPCRRPSPRSIRFRATGMAGELKAVAWPWTLYIFLDPVALFRPWLQSRTRLKQSRKRSVFCGFVTRSRPRRGWLRGYG